MGLKVEKFSTGPLQENTYIVIDEASRAAMVIDPGCITDRIEKLIGESSGLEYIILTHAHGDHMSALTEYRKKYPNAKLIANFDEKKGLNNAAINHSTQITGKDIEDEADIYISDGETLFLGNTVELKFIHTPGHTSGGMCIYVDNKLFSGDTLFLMSVGRTDLGDGDWELLKSSIQDKLFLLSDDVKVYPGHGDMTSIGYEKKMNPYV